MFEQISAGSQLAHLLSFEKIMKTRRHHSLSSSRPRQNIGAAAIFDLSMASMSAHINVK